MGGGGGGGYECVYQMAIRFQPLEKRKLVVDFRLSIDLSKGQLFPKRFWLNNSLYYERSNLVHERAEKFNPVIRRAQWII